MAGTIRLTIVGGLLAKNKQITGDIMPMYDYFCSKCKQTFEAQNTVKDRLWAICRTCDKAVAMVPSKAAIVFKGDGWTTPTHQEKSNDQKE